MKRGLCIILAATLLCVIIAGCSVPGQGESDAPSSQSKPASQAGPSSQSSALAESSPASSASNGSAPSDIPPVSQDPYTQRQVQLSQVSKAFAEEQNTQMASRFFSPVPLDTPQTVPIKAVREFSLQNTPFTFYSYAEAQLVFPSTKQATLHTTEENPEKILLTIDTIAFSVRLIQDPQNDLISDILGVPSWEEGVITDLSASIGRPSVRIRRYKNHQNRYHPLQQEEIDAYSFTYFSSFGGYALWIEAYIQKQDWQPQTIKKLEQLLKEIQLQGLLEYFPQEEEEPLWVKQDTSQYPDIPTKPDQGPVEITLDVQNHSAAQAPAQQITLHIGDMQNFAVVKDGTLTAFDEQGKRIILPYRDPYTTPTNGQDPIVTLSVCKGGYRLDKALKDEQEYQEFCKWELINGSPLNRTQEFGRPAFTSGGGWSMYPYSRLTDVPYWPELPALVGYTYYLGYGEYTLQATLRVPRPSYYRYGELPKQLTEQFETLLKSITLL